ncbi:hypothetical protein FPSE5266_09864 [Fusarium pseudograminearum]|nr:hypothetical protein FPSE5266_09864 [Fusarium pseudograminearum]
MGIRQFNADVRAAMGSHFPCVSNLRKGDSDGEITFTYTPENEAAPIAIQALSTEPEAYPRHPGFLVFTSSEDGPVELEEWLQEISASTKDKSITDFINLTSKRLATKLESSESSDDDSAFDDNEEESSYDVVFDDELGINSSPSRGPSQATYTSTNRLKRHLREAKREGLHVWIPTEGRGHDSGGHGGKAPGVFHIFSLSIRASKLNVPEEALGAWGLKPSEYVVMLCRLPSGYPPLSTFLQSSQTAPVQFKFGKCTNPNPSYSSAIRVFDGDDSKTSEGARKDESESPFLSMYMSLSLDALLNTDFPRLLKLRRSEGISWDQAQELWFRLGRGDHDPESVLQSTSQGQHESLDRFELEFLQRNFLGAEDINIILIAMQFGLQRLINCTKYCLVCSQRIEGGFEAIKPFVCEDSLCLFQYLSLGFCQSIEYEIINNPNVVDLLISFFYAAVATNFTVPNSSLREFPKGLGLKVATSGYNIPSDTEPTITAEVCFESNTIRFNPLDYAHYTSITEGRCITLVLKQSLVPRQPIMQGLDIENSQASSHDNNGSASYIEQDPSHQLTSNSQRIGIPQSAIPISRRRVLGQRQILGSSHDFPIILGETEGEPDFESNNELDDLLASDDEGESEDGTAAVTRKRRRSSIDSGLGDTRQPDNTTPFQPGQLDLGSLPKLVEPTWAASSPAALRALNGQIKDLQQIQSNTNIAMLGWYIDFEKLDNLFHWIVELHSFDMNLALAQDMVRYGCSSIVLEVRFGASFPISPPFVRVIRPRFVPFAQGGGGHVTMGGSICSELLTNSGWSPALSLEKVFLEVRMNLCEKDPPARIEQSAGVRRAQNGSHMDYGMFEAVDAYRRAATAHGWQIPSDLDMLKSM